MFLLTLLGVVPMAQAATSATATTPEFRLSIKHDGVRASLGDETLRYSSLWDGGSNETAKVTIASGQRVDLPNGGFVDPSYAGQEYLPDYTWNWHLPAGSFKPYYDVTDWFRMDGVYYGRGFCYHFDHVAKFVACPFQPI